MQITFIDINEDLVEAWKISFAGREDVRVLTGDLTRVECDAIVSPANSFGFMDGGVDYAISERLGWALEKRLQQKIRELPEGELLVGKAMILETRDGLIPYLISAPTMRIPTNFQIPNSINAIPGFCTGCGKMKPDIAAKQMFQAYKEIILGERMDFNTFGEAQKYHWNINPDGMIWTH